MKKTAALLLCALLCLGAPRALTAPREGLRGVWVSSVSNLDYPSKSGLSPEALRAEADAIIEGCASMGMNAIFLQVRPCADALYGSKLFPTSVYLSESSFEPLAFDPLEYFVAEAHKRGIELHAWLNPYRVTTRGEAGLKALSPDSPARRNPEYLLRSADGAYFFNPALPEVRELILDGIEEILQNYDVDGIHFDDYFYPESGFDDSASFALYGSGDIDDWRRENVNALVREAHELARSAGVAFGVSPRGIWANKSENPRGSDTSGNGSLNSIYCDSLRFIEEGWVDYICPQIYWNIGYKPADYEVLLRWWKNAVANTDVKLYVGMADYRCAEAAEGDVWYGAAEPARQLDLNGAVGVDGEVHFRYGSLAEVEGLAELYRERYGAASRSAAEKMRESLLRLMRLIIFN